MISLNDYANLRSYAGSETAVMLENRYHHGVFTRDDADTTSQDNGVTLLVDAQNRRWKRIINDGDYSIDWWHLPGDELDYSLTITRACNFLQVKGEEWWQLPIPTTPAGITLVGPGGVRSCKTTANLKLWKNAVDFKGTILDFSGATNIECVRVQYSLGAPAIYNLRIVGAPGAAANLRGLCVYSDASNMHGLPACQLLVQNVWLTNLYKGIVFGNNAYIQSWHSIMVRGCFWPIWSETTANAGEKIVFYKCLFGDSRNYYQGVHALAFRDCSFDYSGFSNETEQLANTDYGLFDLKGGTLDFKNCHFEWGNANCRNYRPVFTSNNGGTVKIKDSQWHSVMTNNTDAGSNVPYQYVEYFFFDKSSDLSGKCYIDGFDLVNADIKKGWSNNHIEMKKIVAPGYINMWRLLYLGDGVNHLPEPSWKESGALALNNVYAFGGARLSQTETADLAVTLQNGVLTATTKTATTTDKRVEIYFPIAKNDLVLWRATLANLKGQSSLDVTIGTYQGKYVLNGDAGVTTLLEKACQWGRTGTVTPAASATMTSDRITALNSSEYLPLPEGYVNYARIAIVLKNFVGSAAQPTSVDITQLLCQKIDIVSRNPRKSW
ncbi:hypothetical protein OM409_11320 [Serratia bockelmannii]|uniref:Uncharacterized protein n=1 Tax=Serratia marcescens TaxID=615 RepID=A0A656VGI7_SERMA|nr:MULTISPECIES: hypothetical protein [Serratia]ASM20510.1 hypothetical protein BVG92_03130 [Serratia marcescens]ASM25279.1 hypothetical protein BVG89_03130 [Serratia marcescens]KFF80096.1 hypothetical protein IY40_04340 [Serratia marcescens]KMU51171.1 hypothetical protein AB868_01913 [Serratia marcescens]MBN5262328.1 hypothetical protein [Serratia marcescens]